MDISLSDYAEPFINGYAIISINGNDALIDKNGKIFQIKSIVHQFE